MQAAVGKWSNFAIWNSLFISNPNLGTGGSSLDTVSDSDGEAPETVPANVTEIGGGVNDDNDDDVDDSDDTSGDEDEAHGDGSVHDSAADSTRATSIRSYRHPAMSDHLSLPNPLDDPESPRAQPAPSAVARSSSTPSRPALMQKPAKGTRKRRAQEQYVGSIAEMQFGMAKLEYEARERDLEFQDRKAREQRQWQEEMELRRQKYEDEREQRRQEFELRQTQEREERENRRDAERMERESRLRRVEMEFQYNLFHSK